MWEEYEAVSFLPLIYTANITIASGVPFSLLSDMKFDFCMLVLCLVFNEHNDLSAAQQ